jgi:hypothetical protein
VEYTVRWDRRRTSAGTGVRGAAAPRCGSASDGGGVRRQQHAANSHRIRLNKGLAREESFWSRPARVAHMQTGISSRARAMSIAAGSAGGASRRGATASAASQEAAGGAGETMLGSGGQRKRGGVAPAVRDDTTKRTRRGAFTDAAHAHDQAAEAMAAEGATAAQASERTSLPDREARPEQDLRDVLAGLAMCEQQMRQMRKACRANSEMLSGKCSAVLESIAALQLVASKFLHEQPPENACVGWSGTRHAHVLAGAEWFRDMAQTMSAVRDVMSRSQAQLVDTAARKQADDIRRTTVADPAAAPEAAAGEAAAGEAAAGEAAAGEAAAGEAAAGEAAAGEVAAAAAAAAASAWSSGDDVLATPTDRHTVISSEGPRQGDLLAIVQRMHAMALDLSEVERASATSLRACAIGAAEWACAASDELRYADNSRSLLPRY